MNKHKYQASIAVGLGMLLIGCGLIPEKVTMDDPKIKPLLDAAASFDRESYGFTPIPSSADVRYESRPRDRYDAMLHIYAKTSRTIAFKRDNGGYRWIQDQENFQGPNQYDSPDGRYYESISLTYGIEPVSGHKPNKININYFGEDPRLVFPNDLTLEVVKPILSEWGY